jgi:hypothetical protein
LNKVGCHPDSILLWKEVLKILIDPIEGNWKLIDFHIPVNYALEAASMLHLKDIHQLAQFGELKDR